jgi:hypothetical protein
VLDFLLVGPRTISLSSTARLARTYKVVLDFLLVGPRTISLSSTARLARTYKVVLDFLLLGHRTIFFIHTARLAGAYTIELDFLDIKDYRLQSFLLLFGLTTLFFSRRTIPGKPNGVEPLCSCQLHG